MSKPDPPKRDPKEPTPLVLMNPELRVRQLRYAANIEASQMVPLHRYYEVLLDLSVMGLEYLKAMKLERAFIIFKRIEYFIHHRLNEHPGINTFASASKNKIMNRLPMIMYVAQQIIVEFVMPVYERQAAYFRYEELQRRLRILNPTAWQGIMVEAARRESEFYSEAEEISTRFGVELASFLPMQVIPDDNHPRNYPARTFPANTTPPKRSQAATDREAMQAAINAMNRNLERLPINADQPVESLVREINAMMNDALAKFFNTRTMAMSGQGTSGQTLPNSAADIPSDLSSKHQSSSDVVLVVAEDSDNNQRSYSPRVEHMYQVPPNPPESQPYVPPVNFGENTKRMVYNPVYSHETYVELLTKTFETNSDTATGYNVCQYRVDNSTSPSTVGFMLYLELIVHPGNGVAPVQLKSNRIPGVIPEPDPGPPKANPPVNPEVTSNPETDVFGIWIKKGKACGPDGVGSLGVLSHLDRAREVLDARPPMPAGIEEVGTTLLNPTMSRKRGMNEENQDTPRKWMAFGSNEPGPSSQTTSTSYQQ